MAEDDTLGSPGDEARDGVPGVAAAQADDEAEIGRGLAVGSLDAGELGEEPRAEG
jgi:hypothetical protein